MSESIEGKTVPQKEVLTRDGFIGVGSAAGALAKVIERFRFSRVGNATNEADERRRGAHRRFEHVQGLNARCDGNGHAASGRTAGVALAPDADEWQYYIVGEGRMSVVSTGNKDGTMDFQAGDVGYVQKTLLHYIENRGDTDLIFLEMFKSSYYQDISFSEWLTHTPPELVMAHLNVDKATLDAIPTDKAVILSR
jgi:mannose-6-phosphate isomerase-like protein (cupin superfamily)